MQLLIDGVYRCKLRYEFYCIMSNYDIYSSGNSFRKVVLLVKGIIHLFLALKIAIVILEKRDSILQFNS